MSRKATAAPKPDDESAGRPKKRPKLRDGVVKRGKTWSYVIRVPDPETGLSKPKWVGGFSTEDEAKAARDEARVKARRGEYVNRNNVTVAQYLSEWIDAHAVVIKPKTLYMYRYLITRYVVPRIGGVRLQAVRPATLTKLYREISATGGKGGRPLSPRTVEYVHAVLRKAFRDAVEVEQLLASNPVERAKRPRKERAEPGEVWTPGQLRVFLTEAASRHRLHAFFHLAAYTGARRGELLNLRWSDVDLDTGEIRIAGSASFIDGKRVEGTTKSGRARTVAVDSDTVAVLKGHRARQDEDREAVGEAWRGSGDYVFTTGWGEPIHPDTVSSLMSTLIRRYNNPPAGKGAAPDEPLPAARLHDLRHIHATTLLHAGVPVHVVAARLGHADPSITLRVYAHVVNEQVATVADTFAEILREAG
ncbi:site-specific integrase [Streptomonospora sp. S1-112]|uniref:Site-specific integrase n=1 Tax=Streptomonospora mangrovi TaxID=2883123 RepID=A0A9X3NSV4_9ACTN|nr:site-specific integrase [Streptomonospora mangrovi]MDA0567723.1 site-specific integrase [Streptomonospora mangrovi]